MSQQPHQVIVKYVIIVISTDPKIFQNWKMTHFCVQRVVKRLNMSLYGVWDKLAVIYQVWLAFAPAKLSLASYSMLCYISSWLIVNKLDKD